MSDLLRNYYPDLSQVSLQQVQEIRQRLANILSANWPDLDTSPNSVAGDLILTPKAVLDAVSETAIYRLLSDLDLSRVANGNVNNPDFVQAFLANLGITPLNAVPASGVVALTFNVNKSYVLDANTRFTINGNVFQFNTSAGNPVVVYAADASNPVSLSNKWILIRTSDNTFVVYLPVTGPAGVSVPEASVFQTTLTNPELVSVTAAGDFDSGSTTETLADMAKRAQATFVAANLNTRSGALSFIKNRWPSMVAVSVILTGDPEMVRAGSSPLGVADGAMDILVKSLAQYASGSMTVELTYDSTRGGWVGGIRAPSPIAFYDLNLGVFQTSNFMNMRGRNFVYATSIHPTEDSPAIAFSKYEALGIFIEDTSPANVSTASVSDITNTGGTSAVMSVSGEYTSWYFNTNVSRAVSIFVISATTLYGNPALQCNVVDTLTGESGIVNFVPNSTTNPTGGVIDKTSYAYQKMLNGLDLSISVPTNNFNVGDFIGSVFNFGFKGRTANFNVNYLYDPALLQVDSVLQDADNKPLGVDLVVKSFMPCFIDQFVVNYRIGFGDTFDSTTAQQNIFDYLANLSSPDVYDDSAIGQIIINAGAKSLISVSKHGIFFPSLASTYVDKNGNATATDRFFTATLLPPTNQDGLSGRTLTYVTSQNTIQFNATVS